MIYKSLGLLIMMSVIASSLSCRQHVSTTDLKRDISSHGNNFEISIKSIEFFGWWWDTEQMTANFNADNPPPKSTYLKLDQWDASGGNDFPHPDRVDVVCRIENKGNLVAGFTVSAIADFKIASYKHVVEEEGDKLLENISWTEERKIGQQVIYNLAPGETKEVNFKDFNLQEVIDKYSNDKNSDLWPWDARVSIKVDTLDGVHIIQNQTILKLIPGD